MKQRITTGILLAILVLACLFATKNPLPLMLLLLAAVTIGAKEWLQLMPRTTRPWLFVGIVPMVATLLYVSHFVVNMPHVGLLHTPVLWVCAWAITTAFWVLALRWVCQYPRQTRWYGKGLYVIGILLLVSTALAIFALWDFSPWWVVYVIGLVSGADIGAYFTGRTFGKHKLAKDVSPAKSIEGLLGGIALTTLLMLVVALHYLQLTGWRLGLFAGMSMLTVLVSVLGDLFESMLKRQSNIKDSGTMLPGHGGVLDRLDSLLAAASVFALCFFALGGF